MRTPTFSRRLLAGTLAAATLLLGACEKNKTKSEQPTVAVNYALSTVGGAFPNQTTYIQGLADLNATTLDTRNAQEQASFAAMWHYKKDLYMSKFSAPATLTKYTFDPATGRPVEAGRLVVPGANTFSDVQFISDTEAYASVGGGLARLVKFNPTTFVTTGEVDLSRLQRRTGIRSTYYLGSMVRDSKLFWAVYFENTSFGALTDSAHVAVIDLTTGRLEKLISDPRTSTVFSSGAISCFSKDANGDIYVQGDGNPRVPSGVLRIKAGETRFDPAYFFDLKAATGKDCKGLYHFGNGLAFTTRIEDPTDSYEFKGPNYRFYKVDLNAKTSGGALPGLPLIYGSQSSLMRKFDEQNLLLSVNTKTENALYQYKLSDGTVSKKMDVPGLLTGLAKLN
ncbi:hypothetical protein BEN47_19215 [Hymenobacter lapidarius]|uniref:DUF4374 domain-containing protein n=1 Tax=Hymenobacter lapidarius TaxID=1908237 RepID=A0A1G1SSE7_9BACT|nr:DUF4374 domain-containing protein [Hymenobacter lapidarius]OGX81543.1 hypothetical protein BEN47_19215 [Hymenobacter lapidarius]